MKRFSFNLQRILALREYKEKDWEIKLGQITGRCAALRGAVDERMRNKENVLKSWHRVGAMDLEYAGYMEEYTQRMTAEQARLESELAAAEMKRLEVQKHFLDASRDRKVLDNLKAKRQKEYYREQTALDVKAVDEMNTSAAARRLGQRADAGGQV